MRSLAIATGLAAGLMGSVVQAQEYWIGQIVAGGWTFCPRTTTEANGQLLQISGNEALFSLYGTTYGGDGRTTFALPDLRGRIAMHFGQGAGLPNYPLGSKGGANSVTLTEAQMPPHSHTGTGTATGVATPANNASPAGNLPALTTSGPAYGTPGGPSVDMAANSISVVTSQTGGGEAVSITNPYQAIRYCVVLQGIFPSRN